MFPEPEFRKPKSQINDDDFLMQLAREMSWFIPYESYHARNGLTEANCNCKPAEEIYIFLTKKLYFGLLKAVDAFARYEIYFAQVNVAFMITPFASSSVPTSSIACIFSNGYQQSFSFDNSNNLFWLDQGLRSTSKCFILYYYIL